MNALIAEQSQLPVPDRHVEQYSIAGSSLVHPQGPKDFGRPVQWIYEAATAFDINPDLATRLMFGQTDCFYNPGAFIGRKKIFFGKKWNSQVN